MPTHLLHTFNIFISSQMLCKYFPVAEYKFRCKTRTKRTGLHGCDITSNITTFLELFPLPSVYKDKKLNTFQKRAISVLRFQFDLICKPLGPHTENNTASYAQLSMCSTLLPKAKQMANHQNIVFKLLYL